MIDEDEVGLKEKPEYTRYIQQNTSKLVLIGLRIIYNRPPCRPHQVAFYDMQGEGCLLLPRSSMGTLLQDLRPEPGFTFLPFWEHEPSEEGLCVTFGESINRSDGH